MVKLICFGEAREHVTECESVEKAVAAAILMLEEKTGDPYRVLAEDGTELLSASALERAVEEHMLAPFTPLPLDEETPDPSRRVNQRKIFRGVDGKFYKMLVSAWIDETGEDFVSYRPLGGGETQMIPGDQFCREFTPLMEDELSRLIESGEVSIDADQQS